MVFLAVCCSASAQSSQINISHDLIPLGIAARNAVPNAPALDSRPLIQAAIQYATAHGVTKVTADKGKYYFLTSAGSYRYLILNQISGLTIDLQGSDIYLKDNFMIGFDLANCRGVTLANFTLDYSQLPFTQVRITGVSGQTISYAPIAGWPPPTALTARFGGTEYWAMVLRAGAAIPNTSRLPLLPPTSSGSLYVQRVSSPWAQPAVLATYKAGDIAVVTLKDGDAPIRVVGGDSVTISGIDVYASGSLGLHLDRTSNSTLSNFRVLPRPNTDRLISVNADGIHLSYMQANNSIENCYVSRTMDDAIAVNSAFLATVGGVTNSRTLQVSRWMSSRVPNLTSLLFIDPSSGQLSGPAKLLTQDPAFDASGTTSATATYTFDRDLPALKPGFGLFYSDPGNLGQGSIVSNNTVEDVLFGRGIFLGGVSGVTVSKNTIRRTNCGGIVLHQDMASYPSGPSDNIRITGNTLDSIIGPAAVGTGAIAALGSIFALATDSAFVELKSPTLTNITIDNNSITNSGRSAIWVGNVNGGSVRGNTISAYNIYPGLALWGVSQTFASSLKQDFALPIAVRVSSNLTVQ